MIHVSLPLATRVRGRAVGTERECFLVAAGFGWMVLGHLSAGPTPGTGLSAPVVSQEATEARG